MEKLCLVCKVTPLVGGGARKYCKPCRKIVNKEVSKKFYSEHGKKIRSESKPQYERPDKTKIIMPKLKIDDSHFDWDMINKLPKGGEY